MLPNGFTTRPAELGDVTAVTHLANTCEQHLTGNDTTNKDRLLSKWTDPKFDLPSRSLVILNSIDQLIAFGDCLDAGGDSRIFIWARVHPDYENQGLGTYLIEWAENRLQQSASAEQTPTLLAFCDQRQTNATALFENSGMTPVRHFYNMQIDFDSPPPTPKWPPNIRVTSYAEYDDLLAINRANKEAFRDHWGFVERSDEETMKHVQHIIATREDFDPALWFVALDGNEVAGVCLCYPTNPEDEKMAHVSNLSVRRPWRKQGLGMALLQHAFVEFHKRGIPHADLNVDASNETGATRLYEKAGMHQTRVYTTYQKTLRGEGGDK